MKPHSKYKKYVTNNLCIHAIVHGEVQGVFFRKNTKKKAVELKLTGWVKNLADGTVELIACGNHDHIMEFIDWLWEGPRHANVSDVQWKETEAKTFNEFAVIK